MYVVETQKLVKIYRNGVKALNGIDLKVPEKCIYGFIGPNGAGKTTTLRILAGVIKPTSGKALIMGKNVDEDTKFLIGYLPQNIRLYDYMNVYELLKFTGKLYGLNDRDIESRIDFLCNLLGFTDLLNRKIRSLSAGQLQMVGIIQTLIHDPPILLLDEPTSNLDPINRREILKLLLRLKNIGKTIIISSHILSELIDICNYIGIIRNGYMLFQGSFKELTEKVSIIKLRGDKDIVDLLKNIEGIREIVEEGNYTLLYVDDVKETGLKILEIFVKNKVLPKLIDFSVEDKVIELIIGG